MTISTDAIQWLVLLALTAAFVWWATRSVHELKRVEIESKMRVNDLTHRMRESADTTFQKCRSTLKKHIDGSEQ